MAGSVVLLSALVAVGTTIVGSSATNSDATEVHLAGPLARADGGVASPGAKMTSVLSPAAPVPATVGDQAPGGLCEDSAPSGASPAALAYILATNAAIPQWTAISHTMGGNGGKARPQDFLSEMNADSHLLGLLDDIEFPGRAAVLAADFETSLREYVLQLGHIIRGGASPPATATLGRLYDRSATASSLLRTALGLSPEFACVWLRPGTGLG